MRRSLFLSIMHRVCYRDEYFVQKSGACGFTRLSPHQKFAAALITEFEEYHMRQPTWANFEKQLTINSERGFPEMFASLDCMQYG